jgi:MATE family multidrug resistance protein
LNPSAPLTRREVIRRAWPIILANAAVPMLGLVDTAVIGNFGRVADLGAIAFGALIFSFVYWGFGFLRMSTTGFVAQAAGAADEAEVRATLQRALLTAAVLSLGVIMLQWPILTGALWLLDGSADVERLAAEYFEVRIWAAPATLGTFALMGTLIGLGRSRTLLLIQVLLNGTNIVLDVWFAGILGWGAKGIALGTAIAEWGSFIVACLIVVQILKARHRDAEPLFVMARLRDGAKFRRMLVANSDIMIRTLLLVFCFSWFLRQSSQFGDVALAANHILLQLVSFSAFFLDGYAFVAEALVGESIGARNRVHFDLAVRRSTELAGATAVLLAAAILVLQVPALRLLTDIEPVRGAAGTALPLASAYVLVSFAAFQLDGIFIGATRTRDMRNASLLSAAVFIAASWPLVALAGNRGLWAAFVLYVLARAGALLLYLPGLRKSLDTGLTQRLASHY